MSVRRLREPELAVREFDFTGVDILELDASLVTSFEASKSRSPEVEYVRIKLLGSFPELERIEQLNNGPFCSKGAWNRKLVAAESKHRK